MVEDLEEQMPPQKSVVLSRETLVTIGSVCVVLVPVAGAFVWLQDKLGTIDRRLERMEITNQSAWSGERMESWALRMARDNPTLKVPDVR